MAIYQHDAVYGAMYICKYYMENEYYKDVPEPDKTAKVEEEIRKCLWVLQAFERYPKDMIAECAKNYDYKLIKTKAFTRGAMDELERYMWSTEEYDGQLVQIGFPLKYVQECRIETTRQYEQFYNDMPPFGESIPPYAMTAYNAMMDNYYQTGDIDPILFDELNRRMRICKEREGKAKNAHNKKKETVVPYEQNKVLIHREHTNPASIIQFQKLKTH